MQSVIFQVFLQNFNIKFVSLQNITNQNRYHFTQFYSSTLVELLCQYTHSHTHTHTHIYIYITTRKSLVTYSFLHTDLDPYVKWTLHTDFTYGFWYVYNSDITYRFLHTDSDPYVTPTLHTDFLHTDTDPYVM